MNRYQFKATGTLAVNLSIKADYVYFRSGTMSGGAVDDTIIVQSAGGGESMVLQPGQGCPFDSNTRDWLIYNASGVGTIDGMLLFGKGPFTDNRPSGQTAIVGTVNVAGTVDVVDGGKARTLANRAYMACMSVGGAAGSAPIAQLWNPANTGKNVIISKFFVGSDTAGAIVCGWNTAAVGALLAIASKLAGGAAPSAQQTTAVGVAPAGANRTHSINLANNETQPIDLREPIILPPGFGFYMQHSQAAAVGVFVSVEFTEEAV